VSLQWRSQVVPASGPNLVVVGPIPLGQAIVSVPHVRDAAGLMPSSHAPVVIRPEPPAGVDAPRFPSSPMQELDLHQPL
jgi:hypothetical protein